MKVKDLEKGMILHPVKGHKFVLSSWENDWLRVVEISRMHRFRRGYIRQVSQEPDKAVQLAVYLGQRRDVGSVGIAWCDRYVLFENKICPVDPACWRNIEVIDD